MKNFLQWIEEKTNDDWWIYAKRLSANDTGLTGGKGVGIYIPQPVVATVLRSISPQSIFNPNCNITAKVSSHGFPEQSIKGTYYNSKYFSGTRNEHRLTRWNTDVKNSPVQEPSNTGALTLFAFHLPSSGGDSDFLDIWVCIDSVEEEFVENLTGEIVPGSWAFDRGTNLFSGFTHIPAAPPTSVVIPDYWMEAFPSGEEIIAHLSAQFKFKSVTPDGLLIERRSEEYKLFRDIEERHILHKVQKGFASVDDFMQMANSVSNRRKSRSGKSLEIHLEHLFTQFGLAEFSSQCKTEDNKRPDFIFPSCDAYHNTNFPEHHLRMLAVKTTCKDRWRQILNEADRIETVHLFTLQEGVSPQQHQEMAKEGVVLVVPEQLHKKYPEQLRPKLLSLGQFIRETKTLTQI